ncbi:MAG: RDD family protein [Bdellovibrionales bacterium]|nr:RDD family protein [Bdellovibrionales bacterium]
METAIRHHTPLPDRPPEPLVAAPPTSRALALLVDYFTVSAAYFFLASHTAYSDWQFLVPLSIGTLYFSVGYSSVTGGRTLGKRVFGLKVLSYRPATGAMDEISLQRSFFRYGCGLGALILLAELPPLVYRLYAIVASSLLLEAHMLLAMIWFFVDIAFALFHPLGRSLHDCLVGTWVARLPGELDPEAAHVLKASTALSKSRIGAAVVAGIGTAFVLWSLGRVHDGSLGRLPEQRYRLEQSFPLRIVSLEPQADRQLAIHALLLAEAPEPRTLAQALGDFIATEDLLPEEKFQTVSFHFFTPGSHENPTTDLQYKLHDRTLR